MVKTKLKIITLFLIDDCCSDSCNTDLLTNDETTKTVHVRLLVCP